MAIRSVKVVVNGVTVDATNTSGSTYVATLAAPTVTSWNVNSGHYYPVTIQATNMANTTTTVNDTHSTLGQYLRLVVKELTAPTITMSAPTANQYLGTATPSIIVDLVDAANGSGVAISTLALTLDGTAYGNTATGMTITSITNGYRATFVPATALPDGLHTVTVSVKDNDGNTATTLSRTFTTDTIAPTLSVTNPATSGGYVANAALTVTGTTSDSTSGTPTVTMTLNGTSQGTIAVSNGTFSKAVTLANGSNSIVVTATDRAGKTTTITRTIILDTSSPVVASVNITPNPVDVGESYTVTISVTG